MRLIYSFDAHVAAAPKAFAEIETTVDNFWWIDKIPEDVVPPKVIDVAGLERVVGHAYDPGVRPPGVFRNLPYIHITSAQVLMIRSLTYQPPDVVSKFENAVERIQNMYPEVFREARLWDAPTFGPATPEAVGDVLRRDPALHALLDASLADEYGTPRDADGQIDMRALHRVQKIINHPKQGGMLTGEEFDALRAQGRA